MTETLPISVVIPAYEASATIAATIESARAQTRPPREIIVVDDGSLDATARIAREHGVTLVVQANAGVSAARNAGIRHATQPWIALLDADDRWHRDKLAAQWRAHERFPDVDLHSCDFTYVGPGDARSGSAWRDNRGFRLVRPQRVGDDVARLGRDDAAAALSTGMFAFPSTLLFRRRLSLECGAWFAERTEVPSGRFHQIPEDVEWTLRALRWTDLGLVERVLMDYAVLPTSLSSNAARMRYGDVVLGELVADDASRYAAGAASALRRLRPQRLRESTVGFMRQLDFEGARTVGAIAFREGHRAPDAILYAAAMLFDAPVGRTLARSARFAWRRALKRIVRKRTQT